MSKMGVAERIWSVEYSDERLWKLAARPEGLGEEREVADTRRRGMDRRARTAGGRREEGCMVYGRGEEG